MAKRKTKRLTAEEAAQQRANVAYLRELLIQNGFQPPKPKP